MVETHACPWCDGENWTLKDINGETRLKCDACNAGFLLDDLPECLERETAEA
jgi:hypothetical protein